MEERIVHLQKEIDAINARNRRVEADKAWETSWIRRVAIAAVTYIVVVLFMISSGVNKPFLNAIVPVVGFLLSTLTIEFLKSWWLNKQYKK